jgi:hypothetical protein
MSATIPQPWLREAEAAITSLRRNFSTLTRGGFHAAGVHVDGDALSVACVATAICFLAMGPVERQTAITARSATAVRLKHVCERWGRDLDLSPYVAVGDLIAGALWTGVLVTHTPWSRVVLIGVRQIERRPRLTLSLRDGWRLSRDAQLASARRAAPPTTDRWH